MTRDIARRLERHDAGGMWSFAEALVRRDPASGAARLRAAGGVAVYTGAGSPINRAVGLGTAGAFDEDGLDRIEAFYRSHGLPAEVEVGPLSDPALLESLRRRGYRLRHFLNYSVLDLGAPAGPEATSGPGPRRACTVRLVAGGLAATDLATAWALAVSRGFAGDESLTSPEFISLTNTRNPEAMCFAAMGSAIGGNAEVLGGGALAIRDGVAGFYSDAVRVPFRGRGVQTALIRARLAAAREAGCDLAYVKTEAGAQSERNYRRAGFVTAYTAAILSLAIPPSGA